MAQPKLEANGKTWCITACYTDAQGVHQKKYKGGFPSQAKAKKWATTYATEKAKKVITNRNITIKQVIEKLLYEKEFVDKVSQNTIHYYLLPPDYDGSSRQQEQQYLANPKLYLEA